jgi:DNA transposition AAA+ family ATPase
VKTTLEQLIQEATDRRRHIDLSRVETAEGLPADFKQTKTFDEIVDAIALGRRIEASLVLVTGQNGGGKTTALKVYGKSVPHCIYWECRAGYQPRHVLADIVRELPVSTGDGWRAQTSIAIEYLSSHPQTFLLDEAQRLDYASLDLIKYVADNSGSMFVLSASPSLAARIEKWPDIASRCPVRLEVKPISLEEFVELYQMEGWSLDALQEIHKLSRGVMRTIRALFLVLDDYLASTREVSGARIERAEFAPGHVRAIAQGVVPMQVSTPELARRA